uniref:MarR family winged helix-turn-helix transcriptional regulator n=1 Tax=Rhodococcus qingshengii TaxID=334542 RepID=UPI001C4E08CE|nr:MarR family transcriptional regulator [Rhodococcus qingshengii]
MERDSRLVVELLKASRTILSSIAYICKDVGLTADEWLALNALVEHEDLSMTSLSGYTGVSGASLTRMVERMAVNSLVVRAECSFDRRQTRVHITSRGRQTYGFISPQIIALEHEVHRTLVAWYDRDPKKIGELLEHGH